MGNREDLLAGAIKSLLDKGWDRTTVRDIASAAGVSHAAIGYHFGSRDALLTAALLQAIETWNAPPEEPESDSTAAGSADTTPAERLSGMWEELIASFEDRRAIWRATIDAFLQVEHNPELRKALAAGQEDGRRGLAAGLLGLPESDVAPDDVRTLGAVQSALLTGVLMQWLVDPEKAPSSAEVMTGLRRLTTLLE